MLPLIIIAIIISIIILIVSVITIITISFISINTIIIMILNRIASFHWDSSLSLYGAGLSQSGVCINCRIPGEPVFVQIAWPAAAAAAAEDIHSHRFEFCMI